MLTEDERKRLDSELTRLEARRDELRIKPYTTGITEAEKGYLHAVEWRIGYLIAVRDHDAEPIFPDDFAEGVENRRYWFEEDYNPPQAGRDA